MFKGYNLLINIVWGTICSLTLFVGYNLLINIVRVYQFTLKHCLCDNLFLNIVCGLKFTLKHCLMVKVWRLQFPLNIVVKYCLRVLTVPYWEWKKVYSQKEKRNAISSVKYLLNEQRMTVFGLLKLFMKKKKYFFLNLAICRHIVIIYFCI